MYQTVAEKTEINAKRKNMERERIKENKEREKGNSRRALPSFLLPIISDYIYPFRMRSLSLVSCARARAFSMNIFGGFR